MAGEIHGSKSRDWVHGYDVTRNTTESSSDNGIDAMEATTKGDTSKRFVPGLEEGSFMLSGFYAFDPVNGQIKQAIDSLKGQKDRVVTSFDNGDAVGSVGEALGGIETAKSVETKIGELIKVTLKVESCHGIEDVRSLHPMVAEVAGSPTFASVDNGASTALGGVGYLHVADNGGSIQVKIQHSPDNSVWTDLITFTNVAGGTDHAAERKQVAGTVQRYVRAIATITTGPATFGVAFGRVPVA